MKIVNARKVPEWDRADLSRKYCKHQLCLSLSLGEPDRAWSALIGHPLPIGPLRS